MFETISGYWGLLGLPIGGLIAWLAKGRFIDKQEIKNAQIGTKVSEASYTQIVQEIHRDLALELKMDRDFLKEENKRIAEESKSERDYFRNQLDEVRKQAVSIQEQLNKITLAYSKEIEKSQNWQKLHIELTEKYNILEIKYTAMDTKHSCMEVEYDQSKKEHDKLKEDFDKLKGDFDKYKRIHKIG